MLSDFVYTRVRIVEECFEGDTVPTFLVVCSLYEPRCRTTAVFCVGHGHIEGVPTLRHGSKHAWQMCTVIARGGCGLFSYGCVDAVHLFHILTASHVRFVVTLPFLSLLHDYTSKLLRTAPLVLPTTCHASADGAAHRVRPH